MITDVLLKKLGWLVPALIFSIVAVFFGKDVNFDTINYHGYLAFGLIEGRINTDFFPAGPQSYLNPVGYIPFYLLSQWFDDIVVAVGLAVLQSSCLYGVIFLLRELISRETDVEVYYLAIILSFLTTVFWSLVGNSFIDAYVAALVLFGLVYLIRWGKDDKKSPSNKNVKVSALLFGLACGLKLTAMIFALTAGLIAFVFFVLNRKQWRQFALFVSVGIMGFLLIEGWWAYLVYQRTGNPFFPFFNNIFASPYYPPVSISYTRFVPESFFDGLLFPLRALMPTPWLYQELRSPDIRIILACILILTIVVFFRHKLRDSVAGVFAVSFFALSGVLWLFTSANGRYAVQLFLMVGVLVAWCLLQVFNRSLAKNILLGCVLLQLIGFYVGGNFRWSEQKFSNDWFNYIVPEKLLQEPALYLTLDINSYSFLASKVHPSSIFATLSGQTSLPLTASLQDFLTNAENKTSVRVRSVTEALLEAKGEFPDKDLPIIEGYQLRARMIYVMNARFSRFGYEVDRTDCLFIPRNMAQTDFDARLLFSCGLKKNPEVLVRFNHEVKPVDAIFDAIEAKCPSLFSPYTSVTEKYGDLWRRDYSGSEAMLYISAGSVWLSYANKIGAVNMGAFTDLVNGVENVKCENNLVRISNDLI